jgi:alpha-amylase/alpha-mannosidase (GH57 family)
VNAKWAIILHFYQPYGQKREIIDKIVAQCYKPVAERILADPRASVTINFPGVLLEQLSAYGHRDVLELYREAAKMGRVELVGSAMHHTLLPLLPVTEANRQLRINDEVNQKFFGNAYHRRGVFLPESAWDPKLAGILEDAGFEWVLLDELAAGKHSGAIDFTKTYQLEGTNLEVMFRDRRLSAAMGWAVRRVERLKEAARAELAERRYIVTAMDGELFGHHQIGHDQLLTQMFADPEINMVLVSELPELIEQREDVQTVACTWASSEQDIADGIQFISWDDPGNKIHQLQWELLRLVTSEVAKLPESQPFYPQLRTQLDRALASDQFYWAAGKPWWMVEYIEGGAFALLEVLLQLPEVLPATAQRGRQLYQEIMALAWDWQRTGKIDSVDRRPRVPFKTSTLEGGDRGAWKAFLDLMTAEEQKAAKRSDYEEAKMWRDGRYNLEHKHDIFDAIYIIDLLRWQLPKGMVEDTVGKYREKYSKIRGGQVEQRSN